MARPSHRASLPISATLLAIAMSAPGADAPPTAAPPAPAAPTAAAPRATPPPAADGDELALFEEMPVVVSASRRESRINVASAPVSVITSDDIRYSGQQTVPDLLAFTPGVDVLRIDRNTYAVGVRGLHETYSDRTLSLIDGRPAESAVYGGAEFMRQPVFVDDIDRIEVVRGPGGAVWGANAFNGVINIITKDPERTPGVRAMAQIDSLGDSYTQLRLGEVSGRWAYRFSIGYDQRTASDQIRGIDAGPSGNINGLDFGEGDDWSKNARYDFASSYQASPVTRVRMGLGYDRFEHGTGEFITYQPVETTRDHTLRAYTRVEHELEGGAQASAEWTGNANRSSDPAIGDWDDLENQLAVQLDLPEMHRHALTIGGDAKRVDVRVYDGTPQQVSFTRQKFQEDWYGLFLVDRFHVVEPLTIEGQIRGDHYTGTGADWSGRLAALYALDAAQDHVLRIAVARAYRTPLSGLRYGEVQRSVDVGGGLMLPVYALQSSGDDVSNEHTWSVEAGLTSKPIERLVLRLDCFYQRYTDLVDYPGTPTSSGPPFFTTYQTYHATNFTAASARGAEVEATYALNRVRFDAWYAYDQFHRDRDTPGSIRAFEPPTHSIGSGVRWFVEPEVVLNVNYRYTSETPDDPSRAEPKVGPPSHRLDVSLSWPFTRHANLMVGCDDVLDTTDEPVKGLAGNGAHETPGRSLYLRGEITF